MDLTVKDIINMFEREDLEMFTQAGGLEGFREMFHTDLRNGISKGEAESGYRDRIATYGRNQLPDPPVKSWCGFFFSAFKNLTLKILLVAGIVFVVLTAAFTPKEELHFSEFIDAIAIYVACFVVAVVSAQTNYSQQKSYLEINKLKNSFAVTVVRAGEHVQVSSTEVMVGDVLELMTGDCVAADAILINGTNLAINNSAMTGEPIAVKVNEKNPFLRGGGAIETGIGTCLVCAVGENSQSGVTMMKIHELEQKGELSPLEKKLDALGKLLAYIAIGGAVLTFIIMLGIWSYHVDQARRNGTFGSANWRDLITKFMSSVTIFLCCIPEGLPLAVTLSLSFSMKRMMADQNFVRNLNACETMGGATTICSDKTGTLTQNKMTVVKWYQDGRVQDGRPELSFEMSKLLGESIAVNSTATHTIKEGTEDIIFVGSSSECALLQMINQYGCDYEEIRTLNPTVYLNEFNSARKRMSTVIRTGTGFRVYLKGAPDFCLPRCSRYIKEDGTIVELTEDDRAAVLTQVTEFASNSLRTLLIAYNDLGEFQEELADADFVEKDLIMIGIVGIMDPLRPEVKDAVASCQRAGVVVRMVTGDYVATARAISKECGIVTKETDLIMEGAEFAQMSKLDLIDRIDDLRVLARSSPTDKYRLVSLLMECGEVVAVTGDGSNDSAALKKANVGLSMGMCGTELAKVASDIVILDDNFSSIVSALKWGRCIYDNLRSFLEFQIPVNFVAITVAIVGAITLDRCPLQPVQILWINLFNDSLGALALATRSPTNNLLKRPPYGESEGLMSKFVIRNIAGHAIYQIIVEMLIMFGYYELFGIADDSANLDRVSSWMFNAFVYLNVINLINCRSASPDSTVFGGIFDTWYFPVIFLGIAALQAIIIHFGGRVFYAVPPSGKEWGITIAFSLGELIVGYLMRFWVIDEKTTEKLNAHRMVCKDVVRKYYSGMPTEQQWDDEYALGGPGAEFINKSAPAPVKVEELG